MQKAEFKKIILDYYKKHGRHDLPWQSPRSLYRVWLSEVMLQQTQVATVIPYFQRFLERFPDIESLANAPIDEVLHLWSGLGYYARARNLHKAARQILAEGGGQWPTDIEHLVQLPGIGRSTAAAILAQALDQRQPILDGNVKRVLARWFGIGGWPGQAAVLTRLWAASEAVTPATRAADYTQAIMDLGATLCTRSRPQCERCPVAPGCVAYREGLQSLYPGKRVVKGDRRTRQVVWVLIRRDGALRLVQRPPQGIWGGLWGFPEFPDLAAAISAMSVRAGTPPEFSRLTAVNHSFSHFDLTITPLLFDELGAAGIEDESSVWYNPHTPPAIGLAAPVADLIRAVSTGRVSFDLFSE